MALTNEDMPKLVELLNQIDIRFKVRRRTAAEWTASNEVLLSGEWGKETDTDQMKQGDGVTAWNDLEYFSSGVPIGAANAGTGISIDDTDPDFPIISSTLGSIALAGRVATYAALPTTGLTAGDAYFVESDQLVYIWDGAAFPVDGDGINFVQNTDVYEANISGDVSINLQSLGGKNTLVLTLTGNVTGFELTSPTGGIVYRLLIVQDLTGGRTFDCNLPFVFTGTRPTFDTTKRAAIWVYVEYIESLDVFIARADTPCYLPAETVLLAHMDGANGSTSFPNAYGANGTRVGTAIVSTARSKFGGASLLNTGGPQSGVSWAANSLYSTENDYTWEAWVYLDSGISTTNHEIQAVFSGRPYSGGSIQSGMANLTFTYSGGGVWILTMNQYLSPSVAITATGVTTVTMDTWHHVALVRKGNKIRIFLDGVKDAEVTAPISSRVSQNILIGYMAIGGTDTNRALYGSIDEARIVNGRAMYWDNFTPPAAPFT